MRSSAVEHGKPSVTSNVTSLMEKENCHHHRMHVSTLKTDTVILPIYVARHHLKPIMCCVY